MARTKLKKLTKLKELPNVYSVEDFEHKVKIQNIIPESSSFTLELGCGHGDYLVELAKKFPERKFIGIDVKGARVYNGAMKALEENLKNVAFLICKAEQINEIFQPESIEEIYIFFPDPHIKRANERRRLISPNFLKIYKTLLTKEGIIHFKTDNTALYEYTYKVIKSLNCEILFSTEHLYGDMHQNHPEQALTSFEKHYRKEGRKIRYIKFKI